MKETSGEGKDTTAPGERGWHRDLNICCARAAQAVRGTEVLQEQLAYLLSQNFAVKCLMHNMKHERLKFCVGFCSALLRVALFRVALRCFASVM